MKTTGIVILNYNNYEDTINCIESIERVNTAPIRLIVVDNGSTRKEAINKLKVYLSSVYTGKYVEFSDQDLNKKEKINLPYMSFLISEKNEGYACGNNKGLCLLEKDDNVEYVMILNNDILFVQDIVPNLLGTFETLGDAAMLSPILYKKDMQGIDYNCARKDTTFWQEMKTLMFSELLTVFGVELNNNRYVLKSGMPFSKVVEIELPSGSCMFTSKSYFADINYFDPKTFLYFEENILFRKARAAHKKNYLLTDLKCIHLGACSTSKIRNMFVYNCMNYSRMYYFKYYYKCNPFAYLSLKVASQFNNAIVKAKKLFRQFINI